MTNRARWRFHAAQQRATDRFGIGMTCGHVADESARRD